MPELVSYADWESGKVKLTDEYFEPVLGAVIGYKEQKCKVIGGREQKCRVKEVREVIGYRGRETGTRLGLWYHEVIEENEYAKTN